MTFDYRDRGEVDEPTGDPVVRRIVEKMYHDDDDEPEPPVSVRYLADWLVHNGLAEAERGYGHVTGTDLAEALLARFLISQKETYGPSKVPPASRRNHPSAGGKPSVAGDASGPRT